MGKKGETRESNKDGEMCVRARESEREQEILCSYVAHDIPSLCDITESLSWSRILIKLFLLLLIDIKGWFIGEFNENSFLFFQIENW